MNNKQKIHRDWASILDSYRIIPRILVLAYCIMLFDVVNWYYGLETFKVKECNAEALDVMLRNGVEFQTAKDTACVYTKQVGGPTTQHTSFIGLVTGIAPAIFGLYIRRRGKNEENDE